MISKFNKSGLTLMVAAGLAIGLTRPVVQTGQGFGSSGEDRGMFTQSSQVNAGQISDRYSVNIDPAAKQQLGQQTFNELTMFFQTAQMAIETKNMAVLMAQYSDHYRD